MNLREALPEALESLDTGPDGPEYSHTYVVDSSQAFADAIIAALPPGSWLAGPEERAVIEAADDWYDHRGGNPNARLRVAIGDYRHAYQQRTGKWYQPVADAETTHVATGAAVEKALGTYPDWHFSRSTVAPTRYFASREDGMSDEYGEGPTLAAAVDALLEAERK